MRDGKYHILKRAMIQPKVLLEEAHPPVDGLDEAVSIVDRLNAQAKTKGWQIIETNLDEKRQILNEDCLDK